MSSSSASETDRLVEGFASYLRRERGVSMFTVDLYAADVRRFVADLGNSDLRELTPADVSHAVLGQIGTRSPASVRRFGCALRSFLRYCFCVTTSPSRRWRSMGAGRGARAAESDSLLMS